MAELIIHRTNHHHPDPVQDRRGCYKRGDIVEVVPDGETADKPHLTVIAIPGLDLTDADIRWIGSPRFEPRTTRRPMGQAEFEELQVADYAKHTHDFDGGGARAFGDNRRLGPPVFVREIEPDVYEVDDETMLVHTRRLCRIPAGEMDTLFPGPADTRAVLTVPQARQLAQKIINKREA